MTVIEGTWRLDEDDWLLLAMLCDPDGGLAEALTELCAAAERALDDGYTLLILSDRATDRQRAPLPALLATAAVHHHLIRCGRRTQCSLIVDSGEPREDARVY